MESSVSFNPCYNGNKVELENVVISAVNTGGF